jgi:hypothetical protein
VSVPQRCAYIKLLEPEQSPALSENHQLKGDVMELRMVRGIAAVAAVGSFLTLSACGGSSLSASSSCRDFMNASAVEQHEVVDQLAGRYRKPDYSTPLGEPEVPYYCSANPTTTLADFFTKAEG